MLRPHSWCIPHNHCGQPLVTSAELGNWRWLGLIALSELRGLRRAANAADTAADAGRIAQGAISFGDAYPVTRAWYRAHDELLLVLKDASGNQLRFTARGYLDPAMENAAKVTPVNGYLDVFIHANTKDFLLFINDRKSISIPIEVVVEVIKNADPHNRDIQLFACFAGLCSAGPAQQLANRLRRNVLAVTDDVYAYPDGTHAVPEGDWVLKKPE